MKKTIYFLLFLFALFFIGTSLRNSSVRQKRDFMHYTQERIEKAQEEKESDKVLEAVRLIFIVPCTLCIVLIVCTHTAHIVKKSKNIIRWLKFRKQLPRSGLVL